MGQYNSWGSNRRFDKGKKDKKSVNPEEIKKILDSIGNNGDILKKAKEIFNTDGKLKESRNKGISLFTSIMPFYKKYGEKAKDKEKFAKEILIESAKLLYIGKKNSFPTYTAFGTKLSEISSKLYQNNDVKNDIEKLYLIALFLQSMIVKK